MKMMKMAYILFDGMTTLDFCWFLRCGYPDGSSKGDRKCIVGFLFQQGRSHG